MNKKCIKLFIMVLISMFIITANVYADSNENYNADFMVVDNYVTCGGIGQSATIKNIPSIIPRISSSLYNTVMVIVPVILVIFGIIDLVKGLMSQKEDDIKKGRDALIKRLIVGMVIFLIVMIVKLFVNIVGTDNRFAIVDCVDCFISNDCDTMYSVNK